MNQDLITMDPCDLFRVIAEISMRSRKRAENMAILQAEQADDDALMALHTPVAKVYLRKVAASSVPVTIYDRDGYCSVSHSVSLHGDEVVITREVHADMLPDLSPEDIAELTADAEEEDDPNAYVWVGPPAEKAAEKFHGPCPCMTPVAHLETLVVKE